MHTNPRLLTAVNPGGMVTIKSFRSALAEADYLVEYIREILGQINENTPPDDRVVCLFPTHRCLSQYRAEFERRGLKCKRRDSSDLPGDKMWVRILGKLAFQRNQPFLERLVLDRFPDFKDRHKNEVIVALLNGHASSVGSALDWIGRNHSWSEPTLTAVSEYSAFIQSLTSRDAMCIAACIDSVLPSGRRCNPHHVDDFLTTTDEAILEEFLMFL